MVLTLPVSYTSVQAVLDQHPPIGSSTSILSADIFAIAGQVEAEINARIVRNYTLPFDQSVPILQAIATDMTVHDVLVKRRYTASQLEDSVWPARWKRAWGIVDEISTGRTPLVTASGDIIAARTDASETWSSTMDYVPTFTEGLVDGELMIDGDKRDDALDDRDLSGSRWLD